MEVENEVSKEVFGIGEKCGSDLSSSQEDPPSLGGNGKGDDPDNSYVFVTGSDGVSDDSVDFKEEEGVGLVVAAGELVGDVEVRDGELDVLSGDVSESVKEVNGEGVEGSGVSLVASGIGIGEGVDAAGVDVPEDQNGGVESDVVPEAKLVEEDSDGRVGSLAGDDSENVVDHGEKLVDVTECEIEQVEDMNGRLGSATVEVYVVANQNVILENVEVNEGKVIANPDEMLGSLVRAETKESDHQDESLQDESKGEITGRLGSSPVEVYVVTDQNVILENVEVNERKVIANPDEMLRSLERAEMKESDHQDESLHDESKGELKQVKDPSESLESLEGSESEVVADPKVNVVEHKIKQVEDPEERPESYVGAEMEAIVDQTEIIECAAETEVKQVGDSNLRPQSSAGAENEMVPEEITDGVEESVSPELVNQITSEVSPAVIEDLESQVDNGGFVAVPEDNCELNDASYDQRDLESTRISEICQGSQVVDPVETQFQEVASKGEKEILLAKDLAESGLSEVPAATSMDTDTESHFVNNNDGTLEELANEASNSDVMGNQEHKDLPSIQDRLLQVDETQSVVAGDDRHEETDGELVVQNDKDPEKLSDTCELPSEMIKSETEIEPTLLSQSLSASSAPEPQGEIVAPVETHSPTDHESLPIATKNDDASSESASILGFVVPAETEPSSSLNGDANVEAEEPIVKHEVLSDQPAVADVKLESEVHDSGAASIVGKVSDVADGLDVTDRDSGAVLEKEDVEDTWDQVDSSRSCNDENILLQENKGVENSLGDNISVASPEGSRTDTSSGEEVGHPVVTRPFNYVMKVPRFNHDVLKEQIRKAKLEVEEKTKLRDAIQHQIQQIRANGQIHGVDYEYAKGENRNARKLVRLKRVEIDSLQSVINKAKNAMSIYDIDTRIYNVEHMIQHETLPLREEKQLIREIKQLRGLRGELSSNMGTDEEIRQALDQSEEAEERIKSLRKELELLKGDVLKTEAATVDAGTKYDNEIKKVRELQVQFKAANDVRQEAYARWLSLRKELSEKNKHFFKYRDDAATASNYAFNRDTESLYRLCMDQVDKVMELWNTNAEFRKEYISFNTRSTIRRFGTLDGRSLGPDEQPIVLPVYVDERVHRVVVTPAKVDLVSQRLLEPSLEASVENETLADLSPKKITENLNSVVKSENIVVPVVANVLVTVNSLDAANEVQEEPLKSKEDIELDRKAEELRKKEAEAKLKEQRRLEGLAKANEARERKKRQAEKIQLRAELKARKDAEEKEKEREKRLKKKERKKAGATDSNDGNNNSDSSPGSESAIEATREVEAKDMASVVPKKPQKYLKQNKVKSSIPPPLRNKNRKKWQQYAYVTLVGLLVLVLFWVGNVNLFSNKALKKPYPFF